MKRDFTVTDRLVPNNEAAIIRRFVMRKTKSQMPKAPSFRSVKKLKLHPNAHVRTLLIEAGTEVQEYLEKRERTARPVENVLRAIVK